MIRFLVILLLTGLSVVGAAHAQTITQSTQLNFATLTKPSSGSQNLTVSTSNGVSGTGTVLIGTPVAGVYQITRGSLGNSTITLDIQNISSGSAYVTLSAFTGLWGNTTLNSFPASGLTRPRGGAGTTLKVGATVTYTSSVPAGTVITPSFDIVLTQP